VSSSENVVWSRRRKGREERRQRGIKGTKYTFFIPLKQSLSSLTKPPLFHVILFPR